MVHIVIKSDIKWCIHLSRSFFLYNINAMGEHMTCDLRMFVNYSCFIMGIVYFSSVLCNLSCVRHFDIEYSYYVKCIAYTANLDIFAWEKIANRILDCMQG